MAKHTHHQNSKFPPPGTMAASYAQADLSDTRRLTDRVREYWESLKDNRQFPHESEVNPAVISEAWDYCFMVDMRLGRVRHGFRYAYMGPALLDAYGMNMTSVETCDAATAPHVATMLRQFDEVFESGEPASHDAEFENALGRRIKYRCCLLPLGGGKVQYILGCMRWAYC